MNIDLDAIFANAPSPYLFCSICLRIGVGQLMPILTSQGRNPCSPLYGAFITENSQAQPGLWSLDKCCAVLSNVCGERENLILFL